MEDNKVVLITGAADGWGARLAARLAETPGLRVIGIDAKRPSEAHKGLDFVQADVRNPLLVDFMKEEKVDTVCHLAFAENEPHSEKTFDLNVMGTMKLAGACAQAGVCKMVFKSSTAVYGAFPDNSAFLREELPLRGGQSADSTRHLVEIEAFNNGFLRQAPEMCLTVLRCASIVGPSIDTPMTRFLGSHVTPVLLGFDPMLQVLHEDDAVAALAHAVERDAPGVFNIAADGALPLSKVMSLAGKTAVPVVHLAAYWGNPFFRALGWPVGHFWPMPLDYLRYPWVADLTKMREELDFVPRYTAEEALREFAGRKRLEKYLPHSGDMAFDEELLRDTIERGRRQRKQQVTSLMKVTEEIAGESREEL